jgi:hypothetical protein
VRVRDVRVTAHVDGDAEVVEQCRPLVHVAPASHTRPWFTTVSICGVDQPVTVGAVSASTVCASSTAQLCAAAVPTFL